LSKKKERNAIQTGALIENSGNTSTIKDQKTSVKNDKTCQLFSPLCTPRIIAGSD